ncbi:MAG: hypothetical protein ABIB71_09740 [Candidatus Woesearchaeota archaeon]
MTGPINLARPLLVLRKEKTCIRPYHRHKMIYIGRSQLGNRNELKKHLRAVSSTWDRGRYVLKAYTKNPNSIMRGTVKFAEIIIDRQPKITF